jgi:hypothetical protein
MELTCDRDPEFINPCFAVRPRNFVYKDIFNVVDRVSTERDG